MWVSTYCLEVVGDRTRIRENPHLFKGIGSSLLIPVCLKFPTFQDRNVRKVEFELKCKDIFAALTSMRVDFFQKSHTLPR
jgi:hypothetical protein